ncbi:MAG: ChaN family lipoprotein, partial [Alphaproteobacteria bacterium]|nr:ChaN family lipoprotein [Alphaproteobacteria bacterium]
GESHDNPDHHLWQSQTLAQLHARRPGMVLGFEAFPRRVQPVLDKWVAGELSESAFLEQSEWNTVWGFDPGLYMPLFQFARINAIPMVALNVERSFVSQVSDKGWAAIPEGERQGLGDPARPVDAYLGHLAGIYARHVERKHDDAKDVPMPTLDDPKFSAFVDAQLTWDRAMAEAAVAALDAHPGRQVVAIVGRGHMDYRHGIPHQLRALGRTKVEVLTPWDDVMACKHLADPAGTPIADAVFGLPPAKADPHAAPPKPRLGVMIEPKDGSVRVIEVLKDSVAEATGLKAGDFIVEAAGRKVEHNGQLVDVVQATLPGTWLPLKVKRGKKTLDLMAQFPTEEPADKKK